MRARRLLPFALSVILAGPAGAQVASLSQWESLARDLLKELVEINTTESSGSSAQAAHAMEARLLAAGFPRSDVVVVEHAPRKGNLIARLKGRAGGKKPILLLSHLDVVEAKPEDWTLAPFTFTEKDGTFFGRGVADDKDEGAIHLALIMRLKAEGYVPDRDLIVALTADEEGGPANGVTWLLEHNRELIDAEYAINEGGGGRIREGERVSNDVQASEKKYQNFVLESTNPGGHSSVPVKDNAITHLAAALVRVGGFDFPVHLNEITRAYFGRSAAITEGELGEAMRAIVADPGDARAAEVLSRDPRYNSQLRTTCVATMLEGGHARNALPQRARANVNCRILPDEDPAAIREALARVIDDPKVSVTADGAATNSPPSPARPAVDADHRADQRRALARPPGDPHHEHRRHRRALSPERRDSHLRRLRSLLRRHQRPRHERADPHGGVLSRARVRVSAGQEPHIGAGAVTGPAPLVIAHRGASGYRPEHTLASYALAIEQGADVIEPDLVMTKDGVLVARHENEIDETTDVARRFPERRRAKTIDGVTRTGWFVEDFTLAELKTVRARERLAFRSAAFDGRFEVPTFEEVLALVREREAALGRRIGLYPETKHPAYHEALGLPITDRLLEVLDRWGYGTPDDPVFIQSFETGNLRRARSRTRLRLVQLIEATGRPADFTAAGDRRTYRDLVRPEGLREVADWADGIGPDKGLVQPLDGKGGLLPPTSLVADAHRAGLFVHVWTVRADSAFLPAGYHGDPLAEYRRLADLGVDGYFTDFPDLARRAAER